MNGIIYIITNTINNKVYIGQTILNLNIRWNRHCQTNGIGNGEKRMAIKSAIIKYGKENFKIDILEECHKDLLNEKESYYIDKYNSFKNGYNSTMGGNKGTKPLKLDISIHPNIIQLYAENLPLRTIAKKYNVDKATISHILKINDIKIRKYTHTYDLDLIRDLLHRKIPYRKIQKEYGISRAYLSQINKTINKI